MTVAAPRLTLGRRLRNAAYWILTAFDDVFVEQLWHRLRRGQVRAAFGALAATLVGWWGCTLAVVVLLVAVVVLLASA